jgi:hypothetical protein
MTSRFDPNSLTYAELNAVLWAIGQMTAGNARDLDEMILCGMTREEAEALISAEDKLLKYVVITFTSEKVEP